MKIFGVRATVAALSIALAMVLGAVESQARPGGRCAKRDTVATGSSSIFKKLAKIDAEIAWELKVVNKYGLLWYSWWAAENHRFICKTKGRRITCVARGRPCRLL